MVNTTESSNANGVAPGQRPGTGLDSRPAPHAETRRVSQSPPVPSPAVAGAESPVGDRPESQAAARAASPVAMKRKRQRKPKVTCADCYFQRNMLCALDAAEPCPTFRHHEQGLKPPRQLSFVFRQERTRAAWVFEQHHD